MGDILGAAIDLGKIQKDEKSSEKESKPKVKKEAPKAKSKKEDAADSKENFKGEGKIPELKNINS